MKKQIVSGIILLSATALHAAGTEELKAFPTAEGFGKKATGGRGGQVVRVTTLEDDSLGTIVGSLRWALAQHPQQPLTVVFGISGRIELQKELRINRTTGLTVAGQTAPGDGICISGHKFNIGGSKNFILRHLRFRSGQYDCAGNILAENSFGAENCQNFIIDHCTFGWSVEENVNTFDDQFHTVQWSIIHEGLYDAGHSKGARGYGMQWGGSQATYHHNLLAHNYSRSCRFNGSRGTAVGQDLIVYIEYINNINYNWGREGACYGAENSSGNLKFFGHEANFINNYYKPGPATSSRHYFLQQDLARDGAKSHGPSQWHMSGNIMEGDDDITAENWMGFKNAAGYELSSYRVDTIIQPEKFVKQYPYVWSEYTYSDYETATEAYQSVLEHAGAWPRDAVDSRIAHEVATGSSTFGNKGIIDNETQTGGYPEYLSGVSVNDNDQDGIEDEWELANGLDPENQEDRNRLTESGYTALEVYLNSLVGEKIVHDFTSGVTQVESQTISHYIQEEHLYLKMEGVLRNAVLFTCEGKEIKASTSKSISLSGLDKGLYLLRVSPEDAPAQTLRFILK